RLEEVPQEAVQRYGALAALAGDDRLAIEGHQHRRWVLGRVGVHQVAAHRALVTNADRRHPREVLRQRGAIALHVWRSLGLAVRGERPDLEAAVRQGADSRSEEHTS